jgi:signal transduction histidine kinase
MSEAPDLRQRFAFLKLEPADIELLSDLRPLLEDNADAFVSAFYRHLRSFAPTRGLLRDRKVKKRLMAKQREYLLSLATPRCDADFYEERRHIGEAHERAGLEPRWYLGAYSMYLSLLTPMIAEANANDPSRGADTLVALQKVLIFDAQVAMEAYIERKQRELATLTEELAKASRQLAREFEDQGRELREAREWARSAEERAAMATLVAGLAHEIGTPMGVIQGHAKLLEPAVRGKDAKWRLETIQEQIGRITKIIQSLLKMANPERRPRHGPLRLESVLDTTLSFVSENLSRRGISVIRSFEQVPDIVGDTERMQQLFLNLFINAVDAMPDGGDLLVSLGPTGDGKIQVRVSDTGLGISEQDVSRVFEPFFTTKPSGQGTGLGLMVVRTIVLEHGGDIAVSSTKGSGTEFRIRFPAPR